ncbi:Cation/acetate symporter ActP [Streptomyces fumanus]
MSPVQQTFLAANEASEHRPLIITLFAVFVVATLFITVWAGRQTKDAADFYAGGRQFSAFQNGLAVSGDYMSAASFLGIAGAIAIFGYDGFLYSIGFLVAWLVALLLVAEPLRNSGRYTMGDVLAYRMRQRPVRTAAGTSTIVVSIFYLLAQMAGAGVLVSLLLGITSDAGKILIVALVGVLMIVYVTIGGMKGTTWVQMVKAVLLIGGTLLITFLVLLKFDFNISDLLGSAAEKSGKGAAFLEPGLQYGATGTTKLDFISLGIALVLGTAGLPHILIRFYTVPNAKAARKSVNWAIGIIGAFYLMTIALGFGAAALISQEEIIESNPSGNTAAPLLALHIGGVDSAWGAILAGHRTPRNCDRCSRCSSQASQVLRRSGVCSLGLFQASTHTAGVRQPLAEQMGEVWSLTGLVTHGFVSRAGRTRRVEKATPSSHGGSCPASVSRSDGGCGALTKYVTGGVPPGTGTA